MRPCCPNEFLPSGLSDTIYWPTLQVAKKNLFCLFIPTNPCKCTARLTYLKKYFQWNQMQPGQAAEGLHFPSNVAQSCGLCRRCAEYLPSHLAQWRAQVPNCLTFFNLICSPGISRAWHQVVLASGGGEGGESTNQSTASSHTRLVELGKAVVAKSRSSSRRGEQRPLREGEGGGSDSRQWLKSWSSSL